MRTRSGRPFIFGDDLNEFVNFCVRNWLGWNLNTPIFVGVKRITVKYVLLWGQTNFSNQVLGRYIEETMFTIYASLISPGWNRTTSPHAVKLRYVISYAISFSHIYTRVTYICDSFFWFTVHMTYNVRLSVNYPASLINCFFFFHESCTSCSQRELVGIFPF